MLSRSLTLLLVLVVSAVASSFGQSPADKTSSPTSLLPYTSRCLACPRYLIRRYLFRNTPDKLSPACPGFPFASLYVPNGLSNTVDVIDPETYQIIDSFPTDEPQ